MGVRPTHILMVTILIAGAIQLAEIYKPKKPSTASPAGGTFKKLGMPTTGGAVRIPKEAPPCHCPETDPKTGCKCTKVYKTTTTSATPTTTSPADTPKSKTTVQESLTTTTASSLTTTSKRQTTWYMTTMSDPPTTTRPTTTTASPTTTAASHTTTTASQTTTTARATTTTTGVQSTTTLSYPKNCQDVLNNGGKTSGVYPIFPDGRKEVKVFCEQNLQAGGWTVFQRRVDGSEQFYRGWEDYRQGFGNATREHWIGNQHLYQLTTKQDTQLLVELEYDGEKQYATYTEFWVLSEVLNYEVHVAYYTGGDPPGDSLAYHNGWPFSTHDKDNDPLPKNCAKDYSGAWWHHDQDCYYSNLNGLYNEKGFKGIIWYYWQGWSKPLSAVRMMIKPR